MLALITVAINKHFGLADRVEGVKGNKLNRKRGISKHLSHDLIISQYVTAHNEQNLVKPQSRSLVCLVKNLNLGSLRI